MENRLSAQAQQTGSAPSRLAVASALAGEGRGDGETNGARGNHISGFWLHLPGGVRFDHCVEDHEQFPHAGGDDHLEGFSGSFESLGELFDGGVEPHGGEAGHVQGAADVGSSAPDHASSSELPAVTVEGSDSDQGCDLLAVELSQFGEFGQQGGTGSGPDSGDGGEQLRLVFPIVIRLDVLEDVLFDAFDLLVEQVDDALHTFANGFHRGRFQSVFLGRAEVDQLSASRDELFEFGLFLMRGFHDPGADLLSEAGDDTGVDAIGFGQDAMSFGEVPHLAGIGDGNVMAGSDEFCDQAAVIPSGRFDDDQAGSRCGQLTEQLVQTIAVVIEREGFGVRVQADIESFFGNVDADKRLITIHGVIPTLRMRARHGGLPCTALEAVRACSTRSAAIVLYSGVRSAQGHAICRRPPRSAPLTTRRRLLRGMVHLSM